MDISVEEDNLGRDILEVVDNWVQDILVYILSGENSWEEGNLQEDNSGQGNWGMGIFVLDNSVQGI